MRSSLQEGRAAGSGYRIVRQLRQTDSIIRYRMTNPLPWWEKLPCSDAVGEIEMIADPKREPRQDEGDGDERRHQEEALDEALRDTFPASDPVSVVQPTGRAHRSSAPSIKGAILPE